MASNRPTTAPTPLTMLSPVPLWWTLWVRLTWIDALEPLIARRLRKLSFIHFAHWSLVDRWPRDRAARRDRAAPRAMLFITTYDGTRTQYFEAFVRVVWDQIGALYWAATDFPGSRHARAVNRYITEHEHRVDHFWCAHPDATTTMTAQALELQRRLRRFEERMEGADAERFAAQWRCFLTDVQELL